MASIPSSSLCGDLDPTQQPDSSPFSNPADVLRLSLAPCERFYPPTWHRLPWSQIVDHAEDAAEQIARYRHFRQAAFGLSKPSPERPLLSPTARNRRGRFPPNPEIPTAPASVLRLICKTARAVLSMADDAG
jgi:hypothetical protein